MPAVTADYLTLPRLDGPFAAAGERAVASVTTAPTGLEGEGFPVRRAFAGVPLAELDPFVHMDQMGAVEYAPGEPKGTPWHPHRGFETVTYMIDGKFAHQDSHGGGGLITNGATQWMTAGAGILHIETPPEALVVAGGLFHGIQLWVNLPARDKLIPPAYQGLEAAAVTLLASADAGALVRVIAGERRRPRRPRLDPHADGPGPRERLPRRAAAAALERRVQRPGVRPRRLRPGRRRRPPGAQRAAGRLRRRRLAQRPGRRPAGRPRRGPGGPRPRRPADPRAGRDVRAVRDEHQGRARAGDGGLPGRAVRPASPRTR